MSSSSVHPDGDPLLAWPAIAFAEEVEIVHTPDPADGSASVTSVAVDERLPASADLADVVALAPGTVVRELGGLGALATVSIRGSTARQVEVLLDGIPLNPDGTATVNLAEIPLAALSRVDVYRGNAPLELGATAIGGVVNLVSGAPAAQASLGVGTLGVARGSVGWSGSVGSADVLVVADAFAAQNRFRYLDDRGTVYVAADDVVRERENADRAQGTVHARVRVGDDRLRLTALTAALARDEGVPGFSFAPTTRVRYGVVRELSAVELSSRRGPWRVTALGWVQARRERLDDRHGDVGVGDQVTRDDSVSPGVRATAAVAVGEDLALVGLIEGRGDRYVARDTLVDSEAVHGRAVGRGSAGATWHVGRLALSPAVVATGIHAEGARLASVDPRVAARIELTDALALTANVGRYLRPPDLTELYGDRGLLIGNADLAPERGSQADVGLRWVGDRVRAELVGFHSRARDQIVWVQTAQQVVVPINLDRSRVAGVEGAVSLDLRRIELWTAATRTWSVNLSADPAYAGRELPRLPRWELHQRIALVGGPGRVGYTLAYASATWFDAVNWHRSAPRTIHGLFARLVEGPLSAEAEILNLTDRIAEDVPRNPLADDGQLTTVPVTDFVGQPLPGRTFLLTLRYTP